jgi:hypothetical protein
MKNPPRYLRLFDVQKYREIQPIIEGIDRRDAGTEDVISLLKAAKEVAETNDFIIYNDPDQDDSYSEEMQKRINLIQKSGIAAWFDSLDRGEHLGSDVVVQIYSYICCPKYQDLAHGDLAISDMTVEYQMLRYGLGICDLYLPGLLSSKSLPVEILPNDIKDEGNVFSIISREQFPEITEAAKTDVFNLLQLDCEDNSYIIETRDECLEIYKRFNHLLNAANSHANYTLFMEELTDY